MNIARTLLAVISLLGALSAQQTGQPSPPLLRLDLLIFRVDIGGSEAGIGLQWPRVGLDIGQVVGVSVGIGPTEEPAPPPTPAPIAFAALEEELATALTRLNELISSGASAEQLTNAQNDIAALMARKQAQADLML